MAGDRYLLTDKEGTYFLTLRVVDWLDVFTRKEHAQVICDSLNHCSEHKGLIVNAWVIMSHHLHLIVRAKNGHDISAILRDFKKFTSKKIVAQIETEPESRRKWLLRHMEFRASLVKRVKNYKFWEDGNHAVLLDTTEKVEHRLNYLHMNPVQAQIVREPDHYVFSSAGDYAGIPGEVKVELI